SGRADLQRFQRVMVGQLFLVLFNPAVERVGQRIDGGVHVHVDGVGVHHGAVQQHLGFGFVSLFLDREYAVNVNDVVGVSDDAVQLLFDVALHGSGDIDVVTSDVQLHGSLLYGLTTDS